VAIKINKTTPKSKRRLKFKDLQNGDIFTIDGSNYWWIKSSVNDAVSLHGEVEIIADETNVSRLKTDLVFNISDDDLEEWV
jgi:hypothetical protein